MKTFEVLCKFAFFWFLVLGVFLYFPLATQAAVGNPVGIKTLDTFPSARIEQTEKILGPAGEIFQFFTCTNQNLGFTIANATIPPGAGPLPHIHHYTNEWFWTPQGGLELFQSAQEFPDLQKPASDEQAGRTTIYTVQTQPNQVVYGPKYRVHGFTNVTTETRPLTFIWLRDNTSAEYPSHDGGIREYFQDVGIPIQDLDHLPPITDQAKEEFITHAPQYGINQSSYFLQYVANVSNQLPASLAKLNNNQDLTAIIDTINAYNQGDTSIRCF